MRRNSGSMLRVVKIHKVRPPRHIRQRGQPVLNDYLADAALKRKLCIAAASVPFNKNDLAEALAQRMFRESPPDVVQKTRAEMIEAGLDPDFPNIAKRLISYLRDNE